MEPLLKTRFSLALLIFIAPHDRQDASRSVSADLRRTVYRNSHVHVGAETAETRLNLVLTNAIPRFVFDQILQWPDILARAAAARAICFVRFENPIEKIASIGALGIDMLAAARTQEEELRNGDTKESKGKQQRRSIAQRADQTDRQQDQIDYGTRAVVQVRALSEKCNALFGLKSASRMSFDRAP